MMLGFLLATELEEVFGIELEPSEIFALKSYEDGLALLRNHNISI